jgi:WD40-like Beta Propeller Repeat
MNVFISKIPVVFAFTLSANFAYSQTGNTKFKPAKVPTIFAEGIISTGDYETHPAFSPTSDTLFFLKGAPDFSTWTICVSYFRNGKWTSPEVAPFSGRYMDADPFVTKDGKEVYFISNRPIKEGDSVKIDEDIWKVVKKGNGWSKPIHLDEPINTIYDEYYPTIADNGIMYFGSERPGGKGGCDIYKSNSINGKYQLPENLGDSINTADNEYEPFISPDESYLIYMATRPNGLKNADLFVSYNINGQRTKAEKLPAPFNSAATEWSPKVTRDSKYLFFGSARNKMTRTLKYPENMLQLNKRIYSAGNGLGDIYFVDLSALQLKLKQIKTPDNDYGY